MKITRLTALTALLALATSFGSTAQTVVKDINPGGSAGSTYNAMATVGNTVYFTAHDGTSIGLWRSDGTTAGTTEVPLPAGVTFYGQMAELGGKLIFGGRTAANGVELYSTDGTAAGTALLKDIHVGMNGSYPSSFGRVGSLLYFSARDSGGNYELYRTDGTPAGTRLVKDIHPTSGSAPHWITPINGGPTFVFGATAGGGLGGRELYVSDGTTAGTRLLKDIRPGNFPSEPAWMVALGDKVYFNANDGITGFELWETDGTLIGTKRLTDHFKDPSAGLGPRSIAALGDKIYFEAETKLSPSAGNELWSYHTKTGAVTQEMNLGQNALGSYPNHITPVGSHTLYFSAHGAFGEELYKYDATSGLVGLVKDIWIGSTSSAPRAITSRGRSGAYDYKFAVSRNGNVFFFASDPLLGSELHVLRHGATSTRVGLSCGAGPRKPTLSATDPVVGTTMTISGTNAYTGGSAWGWVVLGFGLSTPTSFAGDCQLWIDFSKPALYAAAFKVTTSSWSTAFPVPSEPALDGISFALQAYFSPTDAARGFDVTNAVIATVGL